MTRRHRVAHVDELPTNGSRVIADINGLEVAIFRVDDEFHAVANYCIHQGGPLCEGEIGGRVSVTDDGWTWEYDETPKHIRCPWHGWMFDVTTGKNDDAEQYAVPTYDVEVDDEDIFIVRG